MTSVIRPHFDGVEQISVVYLRARGAPDTFARKKRQFSIGAHGALTVSGSKAFPRIKETCVRTIGRKRMATWVVALVGVLAAAGTASAATVTATWTGINPGGVVKYTLNGRPGGGSWSGTTTGGVFNFNRTGGDAPTLLPGTGSPTSTFIGFCLELNEYIGGSTPGASHTWTLGDLEDAPIDAAGTITAGMGITKANHILALLGQVLPDFSKAASLANDTALALQISIWEIVHETASAYALGSGNVTFSAVKDNAISASAMSIAAGWLTALNGDHGWTAARNIFAISKDGVQDYVVQVVPLPAAAWLLGSGLLGLFAVARRKKTSN